MEIKKNIGFIFRKENIVEYKSPDDHVSVRDFYHVYGYAGIYQSMKGKDIRDLTLTFVGSRHPRDLLKHLEKERGYHVEERWPGIYIVDGDIMPIQIIDSRKLSIRENKWLRSLNRKLGKQEKLRIIKEIARQGKRTELRAYYYVITNIIKKSGMEGKEMRDAIDVLEEMFREAGGTAKWEAIGEARGEARGIAVGEVRGEARGKEEKAAEIAKNLLRSGFSLEQTAELAGLDVLKLKALSV
jgi:hypothetical protein